MAKVWFVYEGPDPTVGSAAYELPAREAIDKLLVSRDSILPQRPKFDPINQLGPIAGYKHVVLQIEASDTASTGWATGYYLVPRSPDEVLDVLGAPHSPFPSA